MIKILYQGHGSLRITTHEGKVIYVDPYAGKGYDLPADVILVTHQHFDHNCVSKPAKNVNCVVWQNTDALSNGQYQSVSLAGIMVQAVQAYNAHHRKTECVGYLLKCGETNIYIAGDTSLTQQMYDMADYGIDYAFLPCDGKYNMNVAEAIKCAEIINAKHVIPYHMAPGKLYDETIAETFTPCNALLVRPNEVIEIA
ncbi:MAG: MBL fold metallo-hydrolase [Clostridia bacterium]|nr:MBL fold metallo-hydrolase [Clostridia bacterium]